MAWTDAARAASIAARRAHAKGNVIAGKRVQPMTWYHGGGAIKGRYLNNREGNWIARDTFQARRYAQYHGKRAAIYEVKIPAGIKMRYPRGITPWNTAEGLDDLGRKTLAVSYLRKKYRLTDPSFGVAKAKLFVMRRLPTAHGHASRGSYGRKV